MSLCYENIPPPPDLTPYIVKAEDHYVAGGSFGDVYKCWCYASSPKQVAVKAFRFRLADTSDRSTKRELGIWRRLDHANVVPFLGVAYGFGMKGVMSLVSLWMSNESLHCFLAKHDVDLSLEHRLQFLLDIAKGLHYLHSFPIVHGDLNCNNVLLDADYTARLADFGYASLVGNIPEALAYLQRSTTRPGALRWSAPEQLDAEEMFNRTPKSDIYSFGCIVLQVLSGKQPWSEVREDVAVVNCLAKGRKPGRPESQMLDDSHWDLVQHCCSAVEDRPNAEVLILSIQDFLSCCPKSSPLSESLTSLLTPVDYITDTPSSLIQVTAGNKRPIGDAGNRISFTCIDSSLDGTHSLPPVSAPTVSRVLSATNVGSDGVLYHSYNQDKERASRKRERGIGARDLEQDGRGCEHIVEVGDQQRTKSKRTKANHPGSLVPRGGSIPELPFSCNKLPVPPSLHDSRRRQFPVDLDPCHVPPELRKEVSDWFVVFNPNVERVLDVALLHVFMHESVVYCVRFSADGHFLATGCNRIAQIYDVKTGMKTCVLVDETVSKGDLHIYSVCFSPDGNFLATGAQDNQIRIWNIATRRIRIVLDGHGQDVCSLHFSRDGRLLVSGSGDGTVRIWDMDDSTSKVLAKNSSNTGVISTVISPCGQLVAAVGLDSVVRIWDVATSMLIGRLQGHEDSVGSIAFTPDGKGLVSGSSDKTLKYWDIGELADNANRKDTVAKTRRKKGPEKAIRCTTDFVGLENHASSVAVSQDGKWVVSGSMDCGVLFWDRHTAAAQCTLQGHRDSVTSLDLSPLGHILATGSADWQVRVWSY